MNRCILHHSNTPMIGSNMGYQLISVIFDTKWYVETILMIKCLLLNLIQRKGTVKHD